MQVEPFIYALGCFITLYGLVVWLLWLNEQKEEKQDGNTKLK